MPLPLFHTEERFVDLMTDIQKGGRLIHDQHFRFLSDGPGQKNPLSLTVADLRKIPVLQVLGSDGPKGAVNHLEVPCGKPSRKPCIRIAAVAHHVPAGHQLGIDPVCHEKGDRACSFIFRNCFQIPAVQTDAAADRREHSRKGLQDGGFSRAVRTYERDQLSGAKADGNIPDHCISGITRIQSFRI